jgi:cbb3-type cytochrome c oxidase subunit III
MNLVRQACSLVFLLVLGSAQAADTTSLADRVNARLKAADASPEVWDEVRKVGAERALFCSVCHGEDGNSKKSNVPKLAAQNPVYLLDQIERFADGRRRSFVMQDLAKNLSEEDQVDLVVFFARSSRMPGEVGNPELIAKGQELFATCQGCHGVDGMGVSGYANIASQHAEFVEATLKDFRDETGSRNNPVMTAMTQSLSNADIRALAAYIESLPPKTFELGQ